MDVKRLRLSAIDDPAFVTAVQAAAAEADSGPELEQLLRSRGWPVEVVESADTASVGQTRGGRSTARRGSHEPLVSRLREHDPARPVVVRRASTVSG